MFSSVGVAWLTTRWSFDDVHHRPRPGRPQPLPGRMATRSLPKGEFALTQAGRDVLAGAADRVALCGIDRWLGGVHLNGRGPTWRWSRERGELRFG